MKVLFASSEVTPYASTGGLGEVSGALPLALKEEGVEIVRVMPMYRQVLEGPFAPENTGIKLNIPVGFRSFPAEIFKTSHDGVATYLVRRDEFFDRRYLYNLPERDYDDNFERYLFFQKAVIGLIDALQLKPDVVHINDWQTGLLPLFLEHGIHGTGRGRREKVVLTIHNMAYQGIFSGNEYSLTNLPFSCFSLETMEFYGNINCMKNGLTTADWVTTVSKTYAEEIHEEREGYGLQGVVQSIRPKLTGIVNGIDVRKWDPAKDPILATNFDAANLSGRAACRNDVAQRMGLKLKPSTMILGMVTRMLPAKGFDLIAESIDQLMDLDVAVALLGHGDAKYMDLAREWARKWPGRFGLKLAFDPDLGRRIFAGSDFFLMPSKSEPCGLNQLYAMRYGSIPVVHSVGGLADTVDNLSENGKTGNGLAFKEFTPEALLGCLKQAQRIIAKPALQAEIQKRIMGLDFSWKRCAEPYLEIYKRILSVTV